MKPAPIRTISKSELIDYVKSYFANQGTKKISMEELRKKYDIFLELKNLPFDEQSTKKKDFESVISILFESLRFCVKKPWWGKDTRGDVDLIALFELPDGRIQAFTIEVSTGAGDSEKTQKLWSRCIEFGEKFSIDSFPVFVTLKTEKHHRGLEIFFSSEHPPGSIRLLTDDILEDLFRSAIENRASIEQVVHYVHCQRVEPFPLGRQAMPSFVRVYPLLMNSDERKELNKVFKT